jgi:hypothetical protein
MQQSKLKLRPEYLIQNRIFQQEKLKHMEDYDRKLKTIGVNTGWFESQQKYEVKKQKRTNDDKIMSELLLTTKEIKLRRHHKLKELYLYESDL